MTDNIQEFNNYFAYTMEGILQGLCYFPSTSLYLILGISSFFNIISLKMIQYYEEGYHQFDKII